MSFGSPAHLRSILLAVAFAAWFSAPPAQGAPPAPAKAKTKKGKKPGPKPGAPDPVPAEPEPAPAPAAEPAPPAQPPAPAKPAPAEESVEVTDFDAEEKEADSRAAKTVQAAGGSAPSAGGQSGFKLVVDLLLEHIVGQKAVSFSPNHTLVILQASVTDRIALQMHVSTDPYFFELHYALTPRLSVKLGKLLVPFGTSEFHHLIGGRVDEASRFLPDVWADYGLGVSHVVYDGKSAAIDYDLVAVNGFPGTTTPAIGAATLTDNNWAKGIGARVRLTALGHYRLSGSAFYNLWDPDSRNALLFYSVALEVMPGFVSWPVLNRLGLRGEWARGEMQLPQFNYQRGLLQHAFARAGYYLEVRGKVTDEVALRFRTGQVNPDNTVTDAGDLAVYEPAVVLGSGKLTFVLAWQLTQQVGKAYSMTDPPDVVYAKVMLQY